MTKKLYPIYKVGLNHNDGQQFIFIKRKPGSKSSNFLFSLDPNNFDKQTEFYLGKMRSNFTGTKFILYDNGQKPGIANIYTVRKELAIIKFQKNLLGINGPWNIQVIIPNYDLKQEMYDTYHSLNQQNSLNFIAKKYPENIISFVNKQPVWNEEYQAYVLDFYQRVEFPSVKNFQLINRDREDQMFNLQFGKISENLYSLDYRYPLCLFQALGIAISSLDKKLLCE